MHIPTKKLQNGFEMPVYGLGTWLMGGALERDPQNNDEADIQAIKNAIEAGITHIDTAESYANGYTEVLVGKAIQAYEREKLLLVSKAHVEHLGYDDLIKAAKGSLERLGTKYLDVYLAHRYSTTIPVKETMRAMETLLEEEFIRHIGVSNFNAGELEEAQSYTKYPIVMDHLHLNLKYREAERRGVLKYCQENDIIFMAWRPLQKGVLLEEKNNIVTELAKKYEKTPSQIAINWLISQKNVVTISKTTSTKHLQENLDAVTWQMDEEDIERLRVEYPGQEAISDAVPLH